MLLAALAVAAALAAPRPAIVQDPIPFSAQRKAETAAYARRHYGVASWRLHPRVIVEHYTANESVRATYNTFAPDVADSELHELPGTCAHFVVDRDGRIYQLVPLSVICRHTVGLNREAIGIEHVGTSAGEILRNPVQLAASIRLTAWLMGQYRIGIANVIGHHESLESPYHRELYAPWRCQTHADWTRAEMTGYRRDLAGYAAAHRVRLGPRARWKPSGCAGYSP